MQCNAVQSGRSVALLRINGEQLDSSDTRDIDICSRLEMGWNMLELDFLPVHDHFECWIAEETHADFRSQFIRHDRDIDRRFGIEPGADFLARGFLFLFGFERPLLRGWPEYPEQMPLSCLVCLDEKLAFGEAERGVPAFTVAAEGFAIRQALAFRRLFSVDALMVDAVV